MSSLLDKLTDCEMSALRICWEHSHGKAWEPRGGANSAFIRRFVDAGYLHVVDGRRLFEMRSYEMVTWTKAGRAALAAAEKEAGL